MATVRSLADGRVGLVVGDVRVAGVGALYDGGLVLAGPGAAIVIPPDHPPRRHEGLLPFSGREPLCVCPDAADAAAFTVVSPAGVPSYRCEESGGLTRVSSFAPPGAAPFAARAPDGALVFLDDGGARAFDAAGALQEELAVAGRVITTLGTGASGALWLGLGDGTVAQPGVGAPITVAAKGERVLSVDGAPRWVAAILEAPDQALFLVVHEAAGELRFRAPLPGKLAAGAAELRVLAGPSWIHAAVATREHLVVWDVAAITPLFA